MRQYTTPTISLLVKGVDLTAADDVYVTFSDRTRAIVLTIDTPTVAASGDDTQVTVTLTQEQTATFIANSLCDVEVNWMDGSTRMATEIAPLNVKENLLKEVLE